MGWQGLSANLMSLGGLAIAIGPLVGGAIVEGVAWNWIFWVNVPIGIALLPFAWFGLREFTNVKGLNVYPA